MRRIVAALIAFAPLLAPAHAPALATLPIVSSYAPALGQPAHEPPRPETAEPPRLSETDLPDLTTGNQTHAIYFVPSDRPDENLDADGSIARALDGIVDWFRVQMGKRPRMDRVTATTYDITFVRGTKPAADYSGVGAISDELIQRGYNDANKRYMVFAALNRGSTCGAGYYPMVQALMREYHAVYLDSPGCDARDWGGGTAATAGKTGTIAVQEWLHNEGFVTPTAPHHCAISPFHVCTGPLALASELDPEEADVAFPYVTRKLSRKTLDVGRDDYLDHSWPHLKNLRDSSWLE